MVSKEFVKQALKTRGVTQEEFSKQLGYAGQTGVSSVLNSNNTMTVENLVNMLGALNYGLYVVDEIENRQITKITDKKKKIKARNTTTHRRKSDVQEVEVIEERKIPVFQYGK